MATPNAEAWFRAGLEALKGRQLPEAEVAFRTVLRLEPRNFTAMYRLGEIADMRGHLADAAYYYMRTLEIEPSHASARQQLGRLNPSFAPFGQTPSKGKKLSDYDVPELEERDEYRDRAAGKIRAQRQAAWQSLGPVARYAFVGFASFILLTFIAIFITIAITAG